MRDSNRNDGAESIYSDLIVMRLRLNRPFIPRYNDHKLFVQRLGNAKNSLNGSINAHWTDCIVFRCRFSIIFHSRSTWKASSDRQTQWQRKMSTFIINLIEYDVKISQTGETVTKHPYVSKHTPNSHKNMLYNMLALLKPNQFAWFFHIFSFRFAFHSLQIITLCQCIVVWHRFR